MPKNICMTCKHCKPLFDSNIAIGEDIVDLPSRFKGICSKDVFMLKEIDLKQDLMPCYEQRWEKYQCQKKN